MKIMLVRDRNVLNNNWLAYFANLLHERGHEVVIACDTYGKLGVSAPGHELEPGVRLANVNGKTSSPLQNFWRRYFAIEKSVYEKLLSNPDEAVEGTVKELAERFEIEVMAMVGFLDGIDESLVTPNNLEDLTEDSHVSLAFDKEKLYKNMVDAKADWLYELPQWKEIFDDEKRRALFLEQKKSGTVHVGKKVGRNDPCPCGSGKKYKYCCGR